ncbi:3'-5' exoribonuclease [Fodinisporobacter ferrooxydans]|uniref:3'-5' exoribonuclease n=1 Tax=Fodinisporobacter ferrooxydans TaxID=2901836 RepID=A0ABY4CRE5_9BACL|nr:3'-5' exoribonuclease [Alicyclobacillaceae bacterium MYW30-H2]
MDGRRSGFFQRLFGSKHGESASSFYHMETFQSEAAFRQMMREHQLQNIWTQSLLESTYAVFDTETTGFNPKQDYMFSIGGVKVTGIGEVQDTFYSLIRIPEHISIAEELLLSSQIKRSDIAQAPFVSNVLRDFLNFVGDSIWVAHYAKHDVRFINMASRQCWKTELDIQVVDTERVGRILFPDRQTATLEDMLTYFKVPIENRHHALSDAQMTAKVWNHMLQHLQQKQIHTVGDLFEAIIMQ